MSEALNKLMKTGIPCTHARFHEPVPPKLNKEPVGEFRLVTKDNKYKVKTMLYTPHGLIWECESETNIVPLANVIYVRLAQGESKDASKA